MRVVSLVLSLAALVSAVTIGDKIPRVSLDFGFPPEKVDLTERLSGKKTILIGLPGAFTPT